MPPTTHSQGDIARQFSVRTARPLGISLFLGRSLAVIAIGLANFAVTYASLAVLLTSGWYPYSWQFLITTIIALLVGPLLVLASWAVLAQQSWVIRALVTLVGLLFWVLAAGWGLWGPAPNIETALATFCLALIVLIPCRAGFGLTIVWQEQATPPRRQAQFRIIEILGWITVIAVTLTYFRAFAVGSSRPIEHTILGAAITFGVSALVAVPLVKLLLEKESRAWMYGWLFGWLVLASAVFAGGYMLVAYFTRWQWWGHVLFDSLRLLEFLVVLAISLIANTSALRRIGLRWRRGDR